MTQKPDVREFQHKPLTNTFTLENYVYLAIKLLNYPSISSKKCTIWINNDVYLLSSFNVHIYFRFLDYFNLHKLLEDYRTDSAEEVHVIRASEFGFKGYHF